jgi:hypothetical protein
MSKWGRAAAVLLLVAACGGKPERTGVAPSPPASNAQAGTVTGAAAQEVLDAALEDLRAGKTAGFEQVVYIGDSGATTVTEVGSFDLSKKAWQGTLRARFGSSPDPQIKPLRFIGSEQVLYLTSPAWPSRTRGRWLRLGAADLRKGTAPGVPGDLAGGQPAAVAALFASEARSATRTAGGTTVEAELPASAAIDLATLHFALTSAHVDPTSLTGLVSVQIELTPNGKLRALTLVRGALDDLVKQLPASFIKAFTDNIFIDVSYNRFAVPISLHVPLPRELITSSDQTP